MLNSRVCLLVLPFLLLSQPCFPDGCLFTDNYEEDVYAPDQKVVIAWDGKTETMILSTKVKSADLASFGWVIPVPSNHKPEVELADAEIFYALSDYFNPRRKRTAGLFALRAVSMELETVQVVEMKELDIFDITILKATEAGDLYRWLQNNGFRVPSQAQETLSHYTKGDFFFIAVKIDISNEYGADIDRLKQHGLLSLVKAAAARAPVENQPFVSEALVLQEPTTYLEKHLDASVAEHIVFHAVLGYPYPRGLEKYITVDEFNRWKAMYARSEPELEAITPSVSRICEILVMLRAGMAKPLKISFTPSEPFFPLKISSINGGQVDIAAYVFSKNPVTDTSGILSINEWKYTNDRLHAKVAKYLEIRKDDQVTKLTFNGASSRFKKDVYFAEMTPAQRERFSSEIVAEIRNRPNRLVQAVADGDLDKVKALVALGTELQDPAGRNLLHIAVERCYNANPPTKMVEYLLLKGTDINAIQQRFLREPAKTPLYCAVEASAGAYLDRYLAVAEVLLERGGRLEVDTLPGNVGNDMLVLAAAEGCGQVVELLVSRGVDVNHEQWLDHQWTTALQAAARGGHVEIARCLLDHGAYVDNGVGPNRWVYGNETPLCLALRGGHLEVARLLLDRGATIDGSSNEYATAAARGGNLSVLELLIDRGVEIDVPPRHEGQTPLFAAARAGHEEVVRFLLAKGVDPNPYYHQTPLFAAARAGHDQVVQILRLYGGVPMCRRSILNTVSADEAACLTAGMTEADITNLLGTPESNVPTLCTTDKILCYIQKERHRREKNRTIPFGPIYLILRNDSLIKWGPQSVLAEHVDQCMHNNQQLSEPNSTKY